MDDQQADEDEDLNDDQNDDDYSNSTEVAITAAKSSPLLNLSSAEVSAMSATDITDLTSQNPGMLLLSRLIQQTVQPTIDNLQHQLTAAQQAAATNAASNAELVQQFNQMQLATNQTARQVAELHNRSSIAELRQLAKEFRDNRREYEKEYGHLQSLQETHQLEPTNNSIPTQIQRQQKIVERLYSDMHEVLATLQRQCSGYGLPLSDYVSSEDANLLTQSSHEG